VLDRDLSKVRRLERRLARARRREERRLKRERYERACEHILGVSFEELKAREQARRQAHKPREEK
jgi:hypothetical protein